jgi:hypothetical protein
MTAVRMFLMFTCACLTIGAAELKAPAAAAFERYVKIAEEEQARHQGFDDFLWLDRNSKQKSVVWLGQSMVVPLKTLDHGAEIEFPDAALQHWLGATYMEGATLERARDVVMNFAGYKDFFRRQVIDSKLMKVEGPQFDFLLRLYKKQLSTVLLNVHETAKYTLIDPSRALVVCHSTHIGEAEHPKDKKRYDQERAPEDEAGYLWRLNLYWRLQQADNGVYAELEVISLGREAGGLNPSRFLSNFQDFPRDLTQGMIDGLHDAFPHRR